MAVAAVAGFSSNASAAPTDQGKARQQVSAFVAQHPGAKQVSADTVQAGEGHFITFSAVASRSAAVAQASCPTNAYCWFEHSYYGGNIEYYIGHIPCGSQLGVFLALYGKASSWWNNSSGGVNTYGGFFNLFLYNMQPHYSSVYVGDGNNDKNYFYCG